MWSKENPSLKVKENTRSADNRMTEGRVEDTGLTKCYSDSEHFVTSNTIDQRSIRSHQNRKTIRLNFMNCWIVPCFFLFISSALRPFKRPSRGEECGRGGVYFNCLHICRKWKNKRKWTHKTSTKSDSYQCRLKESRVWEKGLWSDGRLTFSK